MVAAASRRRRAAPPPAARLASAGPRPVRRRYAALNVALGALLAATYDGARRPGRAGICRRASGAASLSRRRGARTPSPLPAAARCRRRRRGAARSATPAAARRPRRHANAAIIPSEELRILDEEARGARRRSGATRSSARGGNGGGGGGRVSDAFRGGGDGEGAARGRKDGGRAAADERTGLAGAAATERDAQLASSHFNATRHVLKEELRIIEEERARREEEAARERLSVEEALQEARRGSARSPPASHAKTRRNRMPAAVARQHWLPSPPPQSHPSTQRWEELELEGRRSTTGGGDAHG